MSSYYRGALSFPDRTRGILNEGGLFGEREGWHLPSFDTSSWSTRSSISSSGPGIGFFVTTFKLDVSEGVDAMMSFVFEDPNDEAATSYRALLFVNGWQYGKVRSSISPISVVLTPILRNAARRKRWPAIQIPCAAWYPRL